MFFLLLMKFVSIFCKAEHLFLNYFFMFDYNSSLFGAVSILSVRIYHCAPILCLSCLCAYIIVLEEHLYVTGVAPRSKALLNHMKN